ncbi:MAG: thioredoxin family protein [Saprospirales bacterium]|nr:thioredoxin family protein [Saprospirales bacterium]
MQKLVLSLVAIFSFTLFSMAQDGYKVGDNIKDFSLQNIDGKNVSLADYKDSKGFIITFTCNHCPYAMAYEDRILALNKKYAKAGYPVIAINPNDAIQYPEDNFEAMQVRSKEKKFNFPYLYDESQNIAKQFGATKTPHVFIVQKAGDKLVVKYIGAIDDNWEKAADVKEKYAESAIDALLAGKPVATTSTKAIGCSIKWKK